MIRKKTEEKEEEERMEEEKDRKSYLVFLISGFFENKTNKKLYPFPNTFCDIKHFLVITFNVCYYYLLFFKRSSHGVQFSVNVFKECIFLFRIVFVEYFIGYCI